MLPTRAEFVDRVRGKRKAQSQIHWKPLLFCLALFLPFVAYSGLLEHWLKGRVSQSWYTAAGMFSIVFLVGPLFYAMMRLLRSERLHMERAGLNCPGCKKPLSGVLTRIAIASGRCGECGERVYRDEDLVAG